ncbi:ABC transporter ATP-binding protein [Aneurinibacillus sp. Ricciae_BoGa-3]|uniref:ABC transporter ATP-binding protein n=1 Tax=Aneurinibacillus sp. Ricciae_BoGa-3 TaxID=3022697 RepID=UPI0023408F7B|nr:ABC transporter ATP-binding protein [Aneurinibacillus sp. Ricciae_BoGa-3]WCK54322.1 ABC transporter ATP-binding protein [Aneurinibacillus sp. Ricciae_BoGa-3]
MQQTHIEIRGVHKTFRDGTNALQPIDLEINTGEVLVLLGPSGCGKSTLLRMIGGLEQPTGGSIRFHGEEVTHLPAEKRGIGFVFQQYALFPTMTVAQNIAFGMKLRKQSKQQQAQKVNEMLELMNLAELRDRKPSQLSGGQQQRVAVARALAIEPSVLLMDEPLTALDAKLKEHLRIELAQLFRKLKITTIYVTHDQVEAMAIADRIAVMNKGVVEQIGFAKDIYHRPKSPFVAQFVGQINQLKGKIIADGQGQVADFGLCRIPYEGTDGSFAEVEAFLRPEDITLGGNTGFPAVVQEVIFLGERFRVIVDAQGQRLMMDVPNDIVLNHGDQVHLQVQQNKLIYA